ncbi:MULTISPECIES: hypothetical protein [unclassified Streptomyces]|uniref:hypothetical protein n=1 Tax=unclassified Streptomyces TaxID=2593676 RepID=UPI0004BD50BF|nr:MULTISPECIES: hypothetical protein [unclassified Streptomyces]
MRPRTDPPPDASRDGAFAAVVVDHGRTGEVIDLSTGRVTGTLENDGYQSDTVPFSPAFTEHVGRAVAYYRDRSLVRLDEDRLVLEGLGDDERELLPGARVFDLGRRSPGGAGATDEPPEKAGTHGPARCGAG